jgi:lysophospholipase L1-like esterase
MPPAIYSVKGHYIELYFDNVVLVPDIKDYLFDVDGNGRQLDDKWQYKPDDVAAAKQPFRLRVINGMNDIIVEGNCTLYVSPANAGYGKKVSIMLLGDSLTDRGHYPNELNHLLQSEDNPRVTFIGSHGGAGKPADANHIPQEGRGGWTWTNYCTYWKENENHYRAKSPFLFKKDGKPQLDFQKYCDNYNKGQVPDFIIAFLGCNDIFRANDANIEEIIDNMFKYSDKLLAEFREASPEIRIGLIMPVPANAKQSGFGNKYGCGQTRWQYRRNQYRVVERMMEKYGGKESKKIFLIPAYINIDTVRNYPQDDGVHPKPEGYRQIANSVYAWLKYQLSLDTVQQ